MKYNFNTTAVHYSSEKDAATGSVNVPVYQTSTYAQSEPGVTKGYNYSRTGNPTRAALERTVAKLEGAEYGVAFASGLAAVNAVISTLKHGDHVVACRDLYGGCYRQFTKIFRKFGVEFSFVEPGNQKEIKNAVRQNTKLLWMETPSNPLLSITDITASAESAHNAGAVLVVDNTFATPYLQNPLALGADIVLHSTSKYLSGHSDVIGGVAVTKNEDIAQELYFNQNSIGAVPGPQDCFLALRGIKTLGVRMDRHCHNAKSVAKFLTDHPKVKKVYYPGLQDHGGHDVANCQMNDFGAMISFELDASEAETRSFTGRTKLFTLAESLGSVESLICHPASMTHASVEPEVRNQIGVTGKLVRLSVGLEDVENLIEDLDRALQQVKLKKELPLQPIIVSL